MTSRISGWCTTPATGRFTASVRLLGYVDCLSRVPGDWYARFCGEGVIAISSPYPTTYTHLSPSATKLAARLILDLEELTTLQPSLPSDVAKALTGAVAAIDEAQGPG